MKYIIIGLGNYGGVLAEELSVLGIDYQILFFSKFFNKSK